LQKKLIILAVILGQLYSSQCFKEFSPSKTGRYTAGIKPDGTLWTWGEVGYGGLGNNTQIYLRKMTSLLFILTK